MAAVDELLSDRRHRLSDMRCGSAVFGVTACLLLSVALLLLRRLVTLGFELTGGGAGKSNGKPGQSIPQERRRVDDVVRPVPRVCSRVVIEQCSEVAACPAVAVNELVDDVYQRPEVTSVVETVCTLD